MEKRIKINPPQLPPRRAGAPFHLVGAEPQVSSENLPKLIERFRELRKKVNAARPQLLTRQEDREYEMLRKLLTFNERTTGGNLKRPQPKGGFGRTPPSSTRKKQGNPKFDKNRSLESEIAEDQAARQLERFGGTRPRRAGERRENLRAQDDIFGMSREPDFGHGGISQNPKMKRLFQRLSDRYWGP